ncbi:hypothetical protein [Bradyrhizobium yuanmingense]|uniref:hypothetical protein n=1 Tax=Bradyrhizobium yuanmingense TaxID=108015 RepID=UPI003F6D4D3D
MFVIDDILCGVQCRSSPNIPSRKHQSGRPRLVGRNQDALVGSIDQMQIEPRKTPEWLLRDIRRIT